MERRARRISAPRLIPIKRPERHRPNDGGLGADLPYPFVNHIN
jgi:hypothetical protein